MQGHQLRAGLKQAVASIGQSIGQQGSLLHVVPHAILQGARVWVK